MTAALSDVLRQRFWIALLPRHPIQGGSPLVLVARDRTEPGDEILEEGGRYLLVRRATKGEAP